MSWKNMMLWNIPLLWLPLPPRLLLCSSWLLTLPAPSGSTSVTTANTPWLYTTIFLNRLSPIDKCPCCLEDPQEEKPILVMSSISTPDFLKELPKWTNNSVAVLFTIRFPNCSPRHWDSSRWCLRLYPYQCDLHYWRPNFLGNWTFL